LEVPKIDFDFDLNIFSDLDNLKTTFQKNIEGRIRTISENLPTLPNFPALPSLPQVNLRVPEVTLPKLELYEYLLRTLQNLIFLFNTISWFTLSLNSVSLTTQINSTISNFYCFVSQIMELISFSNKKSWEELKTSVTDIRKKFSSLSTALPTNIRFRELADGRMRIYFLCSQSNLLYVDIDNKQTQHNPESNSTETTL
jgi:hypothetical protein